MRTIVRFYKIQYQLGKIDDTFLNQKLIENKITTDEMNYILSVELN